MQKKQKGEVTMVRNKIGLIGIVGCILVLPLYLLALYCLEMQSRALVVFFSVAVILDIIIIIICLRGKRQ